MQDNTRLQKLRKLAVRTNNDKKISVLLMLVVAVCGYFHGKKQFHKFEGIPGFYQNYFTEAISSACGHGLKTLVTKKADDFLIKKNSQFNCSSLRREDVDSEISNESMFLSHYYLGKTLELSWFAFGVSWEALHPVYGSLFAIGVTGIFLLVRAFFGNWVALVATVLVGTSPNTIAILPHLRDFSKFGFFNIILGLLSVLVFRRWSNRFFQLGMLALGMLLGVSYGFRPDSLMIFPVIVAGISTKFLQERDLKRSLCSFFAVLAGFFTLAYIPFNAAKLSSTKGNLPHVVHIGLHDFQKLDTHYSLVGKVNDSYSWGQINGYLQKKYNDGRIYKYGTYEYQAAGFEYLIDYVFTFPGDVLATTSSTISNILILPFTKNPVESDRIHYFSKAQFTRVLLFVFFILVSAELALAPVKALLLLTSAVFLLAYPTLQIQLRHHFHLESVATLVTIWSMFRLKEIFTNKDLNLKKFAYASVLVAIPVVAAFTVARVTQKNGIVAAIEETLSNRIPLNYSYDVEASLITFDEAEFVRSEDAIQLVAMEFLSSKCGSDKIVSVKVDQHSNSGIFYEHDYSIAFPLRNRATVLLPVFPGSGLSSYGPISVELRGISIPQDSFNCISGVSYVSYHGFKRNPLLITTVLPENWKNLTWNRRLPFSNPRKAPIFMEEFLSYSDQDRRIFPHKNLIDSEISINDPDRKVVVEEHRIIRSGETSVPTSYLFSIPVRSKSNNVLFVKGRIKSGSLFIGGDKSGKFIPNGIQILETGEFSKLAIFSEFELLRITSMNKFTKDTRNDFEIDFIELF